MSGSIRLFSASAFVSLSLLCSTTFAGVLQHGEVLQYKVKYGFLRLGTLVVRTFQDPNASDPTAFHVSMTVESSKGVPFVHLKEYSECMINASNMLSHCLFAKDESKDPAMVTHINYDEQNRVIYYERREELSGSIVQSDTLRDIPPHVDGPSMLLFTRTHAQCNALLRVPTFVDGKLASTILDFRHAPEEADIDAFPSSIRVRRYDGRADWSTSSEGMSGAFIGLLSDDDAAVPIRTEMKIAVGSIKIELEKWSRIGWEPPTMGIASK